MLWLRDFLYHLGNRQPLIRLILPRAALGLINLTHQLLQKGNDPWKINHLLSVEWNRLV